MTRYHEPGLKEENKMLLSVTVPSAHVPIAGKVHCDSYYWLKKKNIMI